MTDHEKLREAIKHVRAAVPWQYQVVCDAAESTLPKTRIVEVWRTEWSHPTIFGWKPYAAHYLTEAEAIKKADACRNQPLNHGCVRVTGPHQQEVPA